MDHVDTSPLNRYLTGVAPFAVLSVVLAVALFMMSAATQNSAVFGHLYSLLLVVNLVGIALLLTLILVNLYRLFAQLRAGHLGSRLTLRLLGMFALLTVIPVSVVYFFSLQMLNRGIDSWFDVKVEQALDDALLLGRTALDAMKEDLTKKGQAMAQELEEAGPYKEVPMLNALRDQYGVAEATLFGADGKIVAYAGTGGLGEHPTLLPDRPSEAALGQARQGGIYANLDTGKTGLQLRVVVPVPSRGIDASVRTLQVLQPLGSRYSKLADSVQSAFAEYEKLLYLRAPLKFGFTLTLTLVALLTFLIAVWAAIFSARRLVAPIRDLAEGTRAVAQGDYHKHLPVPTKDELGVLVESFNEMTRKISRAQGQIKRSQREAETQRAYLETVLAHLSSGVLSLDARGALRTHNAAAAQILGADLAPHVGESLAALTAPYQHLQPFVDTVDEALRLERVEWHAEITITGVRGRSTLMLRGSQLPEVNARRGGHVIVFDDVTTLIQAERDAAWGEVARRLAHEIKNPLTPIQLSAERIRYKCMPALANTERETLDRATRTIIQQVDALKSMVNDFSEYAKPVAIQLESVNLNLLVRDVVELHKGKHEATAVELELDDEVPPVMADPRRLGQILHNLLLNAGDALAGHEHPVISIRTRVVNMVDRRYAELRVCDNGPGFAGTVMGRLFEPYVTSKEKGTGLGLAIVKKIVEEHGGVLWAENREHGGACLTVRLPVQDAAAGLSPVHVSEENTA
jgi:nitrogen fixation/metabolism regulation signal transduction histidine kinase